MITDREKKLTPVQFMFVDDDEICVMGLQRTMKKLNLINPVTVAKDGIEALELLRSKVDQDNVLPPLIITLDLSMPRMGGLEFLDEIRKNPMFNKLVVFVLTTSNTPADIASAYDKNIAGYIVKDNPTETFRAVCSLLHNYSRLIVLPV